MASRKCQHCGYFPVHRDASKCPQCGGPAPGQGLTLAGAVVALALIVGGIYWVANNKVSPRPAGADQGGANNQGGNQNPGGPPPGQANRNGGGKEGTCLLTLISPTPAPQKMKSEIFIDGALVGEWPPGARQTQLTVNQGTRNIRIVAGGKILVFHRLVNVVERR